jgi:hypothetical protein
VGAFRKSVAVLAAVGFVMAAPAGAQVPTPPTPPTPRALDPVTNALADAVDSLGVLGPGRELPELPPPICPARDGAEWDCTIGAQPARCTEHRSYLGGPYYQSSASCVVKLGPVVVECTETTSGSQYVNDYDRSCQVTRATKPIAGCRDVRSTGFDTKVTRRCTVGPISYTCYDEFGGPAGSDPPPPKHCALSGVPGRSRR